MKEFRDDLLELLLAHVGEYIDITPLIDKYCGYGDEFESGDETKINCRLNINLHLRELKEMGWVNTTGELNTGHHMNHQTGKREFILDYPVKVRMTMKGELKYKALTKQKNPTVTNIQHIGINSGAAIQGSTLFETDFQHSTNPTTVQNIETPSTGTKTSLGKFIINNIVWVIITTVIGGLIVGFLLYKFGWI